MMMSVKLNHSNYLVAILTNIKLMIDYSVVAINLTHCDKTYVEVFKKTD